MFVLSQNQESLKYETLDRVLTFSTFIFFVAPISAPIDAAVSILSPTTLSYLFAPPSEDHNGIIQYYTILVIEIDTNTTFEFTSTNTSILINTLHPHYSYTIQCAAVTVAQGPYTSKITTMMPEDGKYTSHPII